MSNNTNLNNNHSSDHSDSINNIDSHSDNNSSTTNPSNINNNSRSELIRMNSKKRKRVVNLLVRSVGTPIQQGYVSSGIGKPSFVHALVVIFLEFFAWGLLTDQVITGILSFLSAPLIGAMSDMWGRKVFLLITVFFTCLPIPLMRINPMWYFAMISISGLFAVTFSVVFAYVADVTDESNRATAYGLVSATFAASLITSPALGTYLSRFYSENFVIALATAIAVFDLFFILVAVPESLPEKLRERSKTINWENIDPFKSLKVIFNDPTITMLCITVFLSYLPEAGQYSCFFVYLKLIVGFAQQEVAYFIAYVGILSCIAQVLQLTAYGFAAQPWLIWFSGFLAAMSSIGYPAISAYISNQSSADQQGVSQGMVTGIRGLCNGIGPAMYGFIFWLFRVNLNETSQNNTNVPGPDQSTTKTSYASTHLLPGPPFLFGAVLALAAIFVTWLIPSSNKHSVLISQRSNKDRTVVKIGNTSATYNRTSSSSSLNNASNPNLLSSNVIASTSADAASQEQQQLLLDDSHANILSLSSNSSVSMAMPSHLSSSATATTTLTNLLQNPSPEPVSGTTGYFINTANSGLLEAATTTTTKLISSLSSSPTQTQMTTSSTSNEQLSRQLSNPTYQFDLNNSTTTLPTKSNKTYDSSIKYLNYSKVNLD